MPGFRLITIPMSHYCEKARWGLERLGIDYHEERHLQVFHYPRTYWVSRGPNVPVLIDAGEVITDSTNILKHLDRYAEPGKRLYPEDPAERAEVEKLEDLFDEVLGIESRRWVYYHFKNHPIPALRTAGQGAPNIEKILAPFIYPVIALLINKLVRPTATNVASGIEQIHEIIKKTDALLVDGRPYLTGSRFTAADLSLACMMSPLVLPENYGIRLPAVEELPKAARPLVQEFQSTETGKFALRLFEDEKPQHIRSE